MKKAILCISIFCVFFIFQSCKKDKVTVPTYPITGLWIGTYNIIEAIESGEDFYYSFYIRRDDSIQVQGVGADGHTYYGIGTWTLTDSTLQATFTTTNSGQQGVIQNATAIYDEKKGVLKDGIVETPGQFFKASFKLSRTN